MAERSFVMLSRTAPAADPESDPIVTEALIRLSALNVTEVSAGVPKLQGLWKAGADYYASGTWQPLIGTGNFTGFNTAVPTLTAGGGPDGTDTLLGRSSGNPGVLVAPSGLMNWDEEADFSLVAVIDPGASGSSAKAIAAGFDYDNTPVFQVRTDFGLSADFDVDVSSGTLTVFGSQIPTGRFWVVALCWDASAGLMRIRRGDASAIGSATITPNPVQVPRLTLFGGPEQPPELTPGTTRYRVPAFNMKMAAFAKFNVDLFEDTAAFDLMWAWLEETYPSACAAP